MMFFFLLLFSSCVFSQVPNWLAPARSSSSLSEVSSSSSEQVKTVYRTKTVRDTVYLTNVDTVLKTDTVVKTDTVYRTHTQYKYVIRYAFTSLNVEITNPEWLDYASVNELIGRDTATFRVGSEEVRTLATTIDNFGNKIPQTDIITTGFTINVNGDKVSIEYRGKNSLATFSGHFDNEGFLFATGDITETNFLASFFPFNLFFGSVKKKIIIEIFREARE